MNDNGEIVQVSVAHCDGCGYDFALGDGETVLDYFIDGQCKGTYCLFCRAAMDTEHEP